MMGGASGSLKGVDAHDDAAMDRIIDALPAAARAAAQATPPQD